MIKTPAYIHFLQPGLLTSVQDFGRFDLTQLGVPYAGVMDRLSMTQANHLLQNKKTASVLEMAGVGPKMVFEMPTRIVFTGAPADIYHNRRPVKLGQVITIEEEDVLYVRKFRKGQWLYMGIEGGFETEVVAGSQSWYQGITNQQKVEKGDSLCYLYEDKYHPPLGSHPKIKSDWFHQSTIRVFPGPEWQELPKLIQNRISNKTFSISELVNRMAYQLEEIIVNEVEPIYTAPVFPGTIQLTPSGKLIVLMRDGQLTGGYPRILQVNGDDLNIFSQKKPGEKIKFSILKSDEI